MEAANTDGAPMGYKMALQMISRDLRLVLAH